MKKATIFGLTILLTSAISIFLFSCLSGNPTYPKSVIQTKIHSTILNEEREVIIHLPRDYDKNKKYPVMYVLDGSSQDKHIANKFDILSSAGYVPETIIVGLPNVSGKGRQRDYTPPYMRMDIDEKDSPFGEGDKFLSFMKEELFPFMEKNYSVSEIRSLAGNSRGGLLVIYSVIHQPDLFQGRFSFSPALWRDDHKIVKMMSDFLNTKPKLNSYLYMSIGEEEVPKMKNGFSDMVKVLSEEETDELVWYSEFIKDAVHQNNAQISATAAIRKWSDYLKTME